MMRTHATGMRLAGVAPALLLVLALGACGAATRTAAPPTAESPKPLPPDMTGRPVMILPAQLAPGGRRDPQTGEVVAGLDLELAYWLEDRGPRVRWTFPAELREALRRNAMLRIDIDALAVGSFHRAQVKNIGDPLLGDLRRLGAVVDARWAVVPVAATWVERADGARVEVAVAIIDTVGGRVLWYGIMAGEPAPVGSREGAASAARAVARALLP